MQNAFSYWPAWVALAATGLAILNQAITESQKLANVFGRFGRKLYDRARRRARMDNEEFNTALDKRLEVKRTEWRKEWEADEARALTALRRDMTYVAGVAESQQERLDTLEFEVRCHTAYSEYEAAWHNRLRILAERANNNGGEIPVALLPEHVHYDEFEERCKSEGNMNWRRWGIL